MIKRIFGYSLLLILSYTAFLVATLPASLVWRQVSSALPLHQLPVQINAVAGSIWNGQVLTSIESLSVLVEWRVRLGEIFAGGLPVDLKVRSAPGEIKGVLLVSPNLVAVKQVKGVVRLDPINPILAKQRIRVSGDLAIRDFSLNVKNGRLIDAEANLAWSGGNISYPAGRNQRDRTMPMFNAALRTDNGLIKLAIRDSESTFDVISGTIETDGTALLEVRRRVLDLTQEPWPANSSEQDVVFKIKRKLYAHPAQG